MGCQRGVKCRVCGSVSSCQVLASVNFAKIVKCRLSKRCQCVDRCKVCHICVKSKV